MIKKRLISLKRNGFFSFIPDKLYYNLTYRIHCHGWINWDNPLTFAEKLNWLKLYDRQDRYHQMVDKYDAKKYIRETIGEDYVIPNYGVYNTFEEIEFSNLPDKFVLKCTHDSGSVKLVNKKNMNIAELADYFHQRIKVDFFHYSGREWPYKGLKPRIIAETFLENKDKTPLNNYKFHCFNGEPRYVRIEQGLHADDSIRVGFYDLELNEMPFKRSKRKPLGYDVVKPDNFQEMVDISKKLSKELPFVRVDLYNISGKIYFSELTLYPSSGYVWYDPSEWNWKIGDLLDLTSLLGKNCIYFK